MYTKFFFILLAVALVATACAPAIVDAAAPVDQAVQPANNEPSVFIPATGPSTSNVASNAQGSRLVSGEIFLSDQNSPDLKLNNNDGVDLHTSADCSSEDTQPRRQGGCIE